ncbi:AbrB/MazE/SpoVT family DNA-binding domain-containing protein [Nitrospira sp. Nam74]
MESRLKKWGNSIAVRLPMSMVKKCQLSENQRIDISCHGGRIVIEPVSFSRYHFDVLVRQITAENRHDPVDFGCPLGRELL